MKEKLFEGAEQDNPAVLVDLTDPKLLLEKDPAGYTPLHIAARKKHYDWLRALTQKNILTFEHIMAPDPDGDTLLHKIVRAGEADLIEDCIRICYQHDKNGEFWDKTNIYGETPWEQKSKTADKVLLKLETPLTKYHGHPSPLYQAAKYNPYFIQEINDEGLLRGEMLYKTTLVGEIKDTPLSLAARLGHFDILALFLAKNTPDFIDFANYDKTNTWLHELALHNDSVPFVEKMLKEETTRELISASLESQDVNGDTPLHFAARYGNLELLTLLLSTFPNVEPILNEQGNSWIHELAEYHPDQLTLIQSGLIPKQALTIKNDNGNTCLHLLARQGDADTLATLLALGVDATARNNQGQSFLHLASFATIEKLVETGALNTTHLNLTDKNNMTIMHRVLRDKNIVLAEKLYALGGRLDLLDKYGRTPIRNLETIYFGSPRVPHEKISEFNSQVPPRFQIDEKSLRSFFAKQQLYFVFGVQKLIEPPKQTNEYVGSGNFPKNVIPFLQQTLSQFAMSREESKQKGYHEIINLLDHFLPISDVANKIDEVTGSLLAGQPLLTHSGWEAHVVGVAIEKQGPDMVLSIAERGPWAEKTADDRAIPVRTLRFKAEKDDIQKVLRLLEQAQYVDEEQARDLIFKQLPEITHTTFHSENDPSKSLVCKFFKAPICYYANFKTALHDWFVKKFNLREGQQEYKEFEISLRKQAIDDYLRYVPPAEQDHKLLGQCVAVIHEKEEKAKQLKEAVPVSSDSKTSGVGGAH
ncbi:Ankyrin repeats (3 copies) [Legionella lansingensis]|uniref:Ankyrin repeats (3 copies) n=1 Tax=Legionella lansingensis TaxID=45067 RepID=A0A0W0VPX0_9GAMM|nr:ankyrin repeat domain-containing protein [Legionella lansingensis]KTD22165.1 Ankyrin repeats (3 copies) [Legionella lansingensis]SNV54622.1 Ankyrin repeats (3 copies) [Legionella lansingensis]